jgi:hypothetical protein
MRYLRVLMLLYMVSYCLPSWAQESESETMTPDNVPTTQQPVIEEQDNTPPPKATGVVLQALDKVAAQVHRFEVPLNVPIEFGSLRIVPRFCEMSRPLDTPRTAAWLEITEIKDAKDGETLFKGWLYAEDPSRCALEHPVYDVLLVRCITPEDTSASQR